MWVDNRILTLILMPLFLAGVLCNTWNVVYHQPHICAVKGSSVALLCSLYHPDNLRVKRFMWGHVQSHDLIRARFISDKSLRKVTRFQYIGDTHHNCSLKIHQVEYKDEGKYAFKFVTNSKATWTGRAGSTLKVVDLNISVTNGNGTMKEGGSVNLTCVNSCDDENISSAFTWFKNGEPINEGPVLDLSNMSSTSSGNYTCSLKTHRGTSSGAININVEYGPKNTSVAVRPLLDVDAGNITLICSSHANPPVENYTWFKIDDNDITDVGHQPVFSPGHGGQYFCSATNKHGSQNSSVVTLRIESCWATFIRDVLIIAAVAVPLILVLTVITVRRLHRKRTWTPKTDSDEDTQDTDYVNWLACDNNQEGNQCDGGTTDVIYSTVHFNKRKSNMEQQMDSHSDEDVVYITVDRNQLLNPSYNEPP